MICEVLDKKGLKFGDLFSYKSLIFSHDIMKNGNHIRLFLKSADSIGSAFFVSKKILNLIFKIRYFEFKISGMTVINI